MRLVRSISEESGRLSAMPALVRDVGASAVVLAAFAAAATLPVVPVSAAALALLPILLLTAVLFGRDSALLAALLAALMARLIQPDAGQGPAGLLLIAALSGAALAIAAFLEELRRSRAEAKTAHLRSDATARSAAERVEAAHRQLREAEARLAEAERKPRAPGRDARQPKRTGTPDPSMESAFRSEGGI